MVTAFRINRIHQLHIPFKPKELVTFAELALEGIQIHYTNNRMERLMGEVSKRCKGHWRHWSTTGLRNILAIVLIRYTDEDLYRQFKNAYSHNTPFTIVYNTTLADN